MKTIKNKKLILIILGLASVFVILLSVYLTMTLEKDEKTVHGVTDEEKLEFVELNKRLLIIDNSEYKLEMDLLGTWKEYLMDVEQREKYQALMIPEKTGDSIPFFYIEIEESKIEDNQQIIEEELIFSLKNEFDYFELEYINKEIIDEKVKYIIDYKTIKNKVEYKNYEVISYENGYKVSFTYSALDIDYAKEKGYINDMIKTFKFIKKEVSE